MNDAMLRARPNPKIGDHVWIFGNRTERSEYHLEIGKEPVECRVMDVRHHPAQSIVLLQPNTLTDLMKLDKTEQEAWVENGVIVRTEVGWFRDLPELNERAKFLNDREPKLDLVRECSE